MPYIERSRRDMFNTEIQSIVDRLGFVKQNETGYDDDYDENKAKGDLNYVIYSIVKKYIDQHGLRYHRINDFIGGVLTCCQLELYDKIARPFEDEAIQRNGDV
jgi:hypothetical protein